MCILQARTWFNICSGSTAGAVGDDPGCCADPGLPIYAGNDVTFTRPDPGFQLPENTFLPGFQTPSYGAGDALLFDTPEPSSIFLQLILAGTQAQWGDVFCSPIEATGPDGDTLGCIAIGVAWLTYSLYLADGGSNVNTPGRSLSSIHHFQAHSAWKPVGNCTTTCMLKDSAPKHTWIPVGNGTFNGVYHELYFMHTENSTTHRAYQAVVKTAKGNSTHDSRELIHLTDGPHFDMFDMKIGDPTFASTFNGYASPTDFAGFMGESVEKAVAVSSFSGFCFTLVDGGEIISSSLLGMSMDGSDWGSAGDIEQQYAKCQASSSNFDNNPLGSGVLVCGSNLTSFDPSLLDEGDGPNNHFASRSLEKRTRGSEEYFTWIDPSLLDEGDGPDDGIGTRSLEARAGDNSKDYNVTNELNPSDPPVVWTSAPYPSGGNGQALQDAGGDDHVFALSNPGPCWDASLRSDAPIAGPSAIRVDAEHLIERNTIPGYLGWIQTGWIDIADGNGPQQPAGWSAIPFSIIRDFMAVPYRDWPGFPEEYDQIPADQSLLNDLAESLGSTTNPELMTNLDSVLNGVKSRIWRAIAVTADVRWNPLASNPTTANTVRALDLLREVSSRRKRVNKRS